MPFSAGHCTLEDMREGEAFTTRNLRKIRPGHGLAPKYLEKVLGRHASCPIKRGTALDWPMVAEGPVDHP